MGDTRPDFVAANYDDKFIGDLVAFVAGDSFQSMFENYFVAHALEFTNEEEHKLQYYELYTKFHNLFEEQLETFCESKNITQAEFLTRCREASTEDPKATHYINILLSSVEYDTFVKLMKIMRPVAERRRAAQAAAEAALAAAASLRADTKGEEGERGGGEDGKEGKGGEEGGEGKASSKEGDGGGGEEKGGAGGDAAGAKGEEGSEPAPAKGEGGEETDAKGGEGKGGDKDEK